MYGDLLVSFEPLFNSFKNYSNYDFVCKTAFNLEDPNEFSVVSFYG